MKRFITAAIVILSAVSCGKNGTDGVYISVDDTCWEYSTDTQVAWPCFIGEETASLIVHNSEVDAFQVLNGTYTLDGHRVDITAESSVRMIRTFSHLKNSSNKNYTRIRPSAPESLEGSVWATMKDGDFSFIYCRGDGSGFAGTYPNVNRKEGFPYGWNWEKNVYTASGTEFSSAAGSGIFYGNKFLVAEHVALPCISTVSDTDGDSPLKGTVWTYVSSGYPGFILFTSATEFVRVLVTSTVVFYVLKGEYSIKGNSLEFKTDSEELNKTCRISDGSFTYLDKTYSLVSSF